MSDIKNSGDPRTWRRLPLPPARRGRIPEGDNDKSGGRARLGTPEREFAIVEYDIARKMQRG